MVMKVLDRPINVFQKQLWLKTHNANKVFITMEHWKPKPKKWLQLSDYEQSQFSPNFTLLVKCKMKPSVYSWP
jgi:hypothetical protein